jgi:uncharacterized membrane protein
MLKNMKKEIFKTVIFLVAIFIFLPNILLAQNEGDENIKTETVFKAEVIEIIEERNNILGDGSESFQQNLKLKGLSGEHKGKEFEFIGINDFDVINKNYYEEGDKVLVVASVGPEGVNYYITDYVRSNGLLWLFILFLAILILVGKWKGLRAAISLILSFFVIVKFIIPNILAGYNPIFITAFGSILILLSVIYITEGVNKKSHIASFSIFVSLIITIIISYLFVEIARLSGLANEETAYIINIGEAVINFKGLLLAGIIIGTLGVLDDIIIAQVATVEQMYSLSKDKDPVKVFKKAYQVGISHISSMTNTLFLAYAGASMPLLLLFISGESAFFGFSEIINNELIATEIVRTLAGSIGLILSVPISTILATYFLKSDKIKK